MTLDEINPGTKVNLRVIHNPTNAAAAKTLERVMSKDPGVRQENKRLRRTRGKNLRFTRRVGRLWAVRSRKQHPVRGREGESATVMARPDVLKDLRSVARFIEVQPA